MSTGPNITDRTDLGYFPLQDHAGARDGTPQGARQSIAGVRIASFPNPSGQGTTRVEFGRERGIGSIGDVAPWFLWQTRDRVSRGTGLWSQAIAGMVTNQDPNYGAAGVQPFRANWKTDRRLWQMNAGVAAGMPWNPEGAIVLMTPGTDEDAQYTHALRCDPRLVAPNTNGPGECGTLVCDLDGAGALAMAGSGRPGIGGRHARLQALVRVIAVPEQQSFASLGSEGNTLALNFTNSGADGIPCFGAFFAPTDGGAGGGPGTGGGGGGGNGGPVTGGGGRRAQFNGPELDFGDESPGPDPFGDALNGEAASDGVYPNDIGRFSRNPESGHGIGLMAAVGGWGPLHAGAHVDKHQHGFDADGHPINAGHISTLAYFYRNAFMDAPLLFEPILYPRVPGFPGKSQVHLCYDLRGYHPFGDGARQGYWRWYAEVPDLAPDDPDEPGDPGDPPGGPPTGGPPRRPPTGPPTGGPPRNPPGGPTTPGPGGPSTPGPGGGGGPGGPGGGPTTPGGGRGGPEIKPDPYPVGGGLIKPVPGGGLGGKFYPGGGQGPGGPGNGGDPDDPGGSGPTTGGGGNGGSGPSSGICYEDDTARVRVRNQNSRSASLINTIGRDFAAAYRDGAGSAWLQLRGDGSFNHPSIGTPSDDYRDALGSWSGRDPNTRAAKRPPGLVESIGVVSADDVGLYAIHRSVLSGFGAITFRPQLVEAGLPNFEHNPQLPATMVARDERTRPQTVVMRAWGRQRSESAEWDYTQIPRLSRARGGTADGGVMFAPPRFEPEDYRGLEAAQDVEDTAHADATDAFVLICPGVTLGFGTPVYSGASVVDDDAVRVFRDTPANDHAFRIDVGGIPAFRIYKDGGGDAQVEKHNGTSWESIGAGGSGDPAEPIRDDFDYRDTHRWAFANGGSGQNFIQTAASLTWIRDDSGQGYLALSSGSGSTNADYGRFVSANVGSWGSVVASAEDCRFRWRVALNNSSSKLCMVGLCDAAPTATGPSPGIFFLFDTSFSNVICSHDDGDGNTSAQDSGQALSTFASAFRWLEIRVNSSSIRFYIDGALVATQSTNLPAGANACLSPFALSAGNGATFSRLFVDWFDYTGPTGRFTNAG